MCSHNETHFGGNILIIVLELGGYGYKVVFRFRAKHYPFFNGLLYNLEILLAMNNTLLATLPTLLTAFTVGQYWFAVTFVLHVCRRINDRMIETSLDKQSGSADRVRLLDSLRKQHNTLHELMICINGGYGKVLLSTTATIIVVVNVELLELYQYLRQGVESVSNGSHVVYAVMWLLIHIGLLLLMVYPNHSMDHERRRTGLLLYELFGTSNKEENETVIRFSRQILLQREGYRACDIVPLNLSIIATLIGGLSRGFAILIQFASK
ncbi:uncharacterized protein LOC126576784 [Anopheles aquasalis]|uniref:uncharacterized protein LOC126576784 n=1 Tax=Anopheles aquasalis TaxID=42839 RepID=UPI00215ADDD6|nr:uncharacterized protein LOC126576784 [Anopheles aquasalis]